jgi:hypothetical protein
MPFSINDFQGQVGSSGGFSLGYEFEVVIPNVVGSDTQTDLGTRTAENMRFRIESFTLPPRAVQEIDYFTYGPPTPIGGFPNYVQADMNIICSRDLKERFFFMKWQDLIVGKHRLTNGDFNESRRSFDIGYFNDYKSQNIKVNKYSGLGDNGRDLTPVYTCTLIDAFPTLVGGLEMSWDNTEILKLPVSISYRYFIEESASAELETRG